MKKQFIHKVITSFRLWLEAKMVSDNITAYTTNNSNTFEYVDYSDIPSSYNAYQGKFRQLVTDYDVTVPNSGFFVNGNFVSGDSDIFLLDYDKGRVLAPSSSGQSLTITANNTVREVNVYMTEDDEEKLLVQNDFIDSSNPSSTQLLDNNPTDKVFMLPAVFIKLETNENELLTLGGEVDNKISVRVIVLSFSNYITDGVLDFLKEQSLSCIKLTDNMPYGRSSIIRDYPYQYNNFVNSETTSMYIEEVYTSKVTKSLTLEKLQKNLIMGFADFDLSIYRYPNR